MKPQIIKVRTTPIVLIIVLCISGFLLFACGSGGGSGSSGGTGSISFTLDIQDNLTTVTRPVIAVDRTSNHAPIASANQSSGQVLYDPLWFRLSTIIKVIMPEKLMPSNWFLAPTMAYADSVPKSGGLTAKNSLMLAQAPEDGIDCNARGIGEIVAYVYNREGIEIARGGPWLCTDHQGTIHNVPAGDFRKIVIFAIDEESGEKTYRGEKGTPDDPIVVHGGKTTSTGRILLSANRKPNAPLQFKASDGEFADTIHLSWQDGKHEDKYYIYRFEDDDWIRIDETKMDTTVYTDEQPCDSGEIWYKVSAYNDRGESDESNTDSGFPVVCAPKEVYATAGINEVTLEWAEVIGAQSYIVYWNTVPGVSKTDYEEEFIEITETSFSHTDLEARQNYYVVTAIGGLEESEESNEVSGFPWLVSTIDSEGDVGKYTSIALDSENNPHISYYSSSEGIQYAKTNTSGRWVMETVDLFRFEEGDIYASKGYTSIAMDSEDYAHISFLGNLQREIDNVNVNFGLICHATNTSVEWDPEIVFYVPDADNLFLTDRPTSIALDSSDSAYISFVFNYSPGEYITNFVGVVKEGGVELILGLYGNYASLAIDASNYIHVSYNNENDIESLGYSTNKVIEEERWFERDADSEGNIDYNSISLNPANGRVHISYYFNDDNIRILKYASNDDPTFLSNPWTIRPIDEDGNVGMYNSIDLDSSGYAHISYYDATNGDLKYATNSLEPPSWFYQPVDSPGDVGAYSSIAIDKVNNIVHISYYDVENGDLKYATRANP